MEGGGNVMVKKLIVLVMSLAIMMLFFAASIRQTNYEIIDNDRGIYAKKTNGLEVELIGMDDTNKVYIDRSGIGTVFGGDITANAFDTIGETRISNNRFLGWAGVPTTNLVYYRQSGKMVFVNVRVAGNGNSTSTEIATLPTPSLTTKGLFKVADGAYSVVPSASYGSISAGSTTLNIYINMAGEAFSASGYKSVEGQFFYWIP